MTDTIKLVIIILLVVVLELLAITILVVFNFCSNKNKPDWYIKIEDDEQMRILSLYKQKDNHKKGR